MTFRSFGRATLALAVLPGLATLLTSCGGGHTIGYAYVLSAPSTLSASTVFSFDVRSDNGALSPAQSSALANQPTGAVASVVSPDHANLYVLFGSPTNPTTGLPEPSANPGTIVHYGIRSDNGDITPLDTVTTAGTDPVALAIDPSGYYLYATDTYAPGSGSGVSGPGDVTVFAIQSAASGTASSPGGTIIAPVCAAPGTPTVAGAAAGTAGSGCYYPVGYGPRGVTQTSTAVNGTGYVYVTNSGNTAPTSSTTCYGTVSGFALTYGDPNPSSGTPSYGGQLAPIDFGPPLAGSCSGETPYPAPVTTGSTTTYPSLPVGLTPWAITNVVTGAAPSLPVVYITDYSQNQVYAFATLQNGSFSSTGLGGVSGQAAFPTGNQPENILVDPRSKFVYIANFRDGTITADVITANTGALTSVNGSPYVVGTGPLCMAIDPSEGKYFYVVNYISGSVSGFELNGSSGQLSALANQPFLIGSSSGGVNTSDPSCISIAANGTTPVIGTP
jgi:6-phosphogluconolactonase (cycloisomerase 2 family)